MMFRFISLLALAGALATASTMDLSGRARDPFEVPAKARVFIFVRTDCPISNRYAPELRRLYTEFNERSVEFWIVYPDPSETAEAISKHMAAFALPGRPLRDPHHEVVKRAQAVTAPEAAVFDSEGKLVYHGRIDDLWVAAGMARPTARVHDLEDAVANVLAGEPVRQAETRAIGCTLADVK